MLIQAEKKNRKDRRRKMLQCFSGALLKKTNSLLCKLRKKGHWICKSINLCFAASDTSGPIRFSPSVLPLPVSLPSPFLPLSSSSPSLALALIFPPSNRSILSCKSLHSPEGHWMFKILASCNLSITRFRPACYGTRGGHEETSIFRWPFWIFHKTSECQLNTRRPFDPPLPKKSQRGSPR